MTPDDVRQTIMELVSQQRQGPDAHYTAEVKAEQAEADAAKAFDMAFMSATGNIEERKAQARLQTEDAHTEAFIARAEHNRVKLKIRQIDNSLVAYQAVLKSMLVDGA